MAVQPTGWMSSITCYTRYTSHPPTATHMIVSHRSHRGTSHVVSLNHIQVDHTVFTTNHIYATVANAVGNNLSLFLFARFILSQCDCPISHIGSAVNPGFELRSNCWISYRADLSGHGDTAPLCCAGQRWNWLNYCRPEFNMARQRGQHLYHISTILPAEVPE